MTDLALRETAAMQERTQQRLAECVDRLDALELAVTALVAKLEQSDRSVTILHPDALGLLRRIRARADDLGARYQLDRAGVLALRKGIKKALQTQWRIKDLHDLPKRDLEAAGVFIDSFSSFGLIRKIREGL